MGDTRALKQHRPDVPGSYRPLRTAIASSVPRRMAGQTLHSGGSPGVSTTSSPAANRPSGVARHPQLGNYDDRGSDHAARAAAVGAEVMASAQSRSNVSGVATEAETWSPQARQKLLTGPIVFWAAA